jgi:hypothetical protein
VYEWVGGKHAQVDLNEVSPLAGLKAKTFIVGQTTLKVVLSKMPMRKHMLSINILLYLSITFDIIDFLAPVILLQLIGIGISV